MKDKYFEMGLTLNLNPSNLRGVSKSTDPTRERDLTLNFWPYLYFVRKSADCRDVFLEKSGEMMRPKDRLQLSSN